MWALAVVRIVAAILAGKLVSRKTLNRVKAGRVVGFTNDFSETTLAPASE